ncbi:S1 domain-containing post-transcriptional regulator GSP13 [Bacillus kexueae]|uniref:S1 domain-containing post-transcriptional regulator GSP13 n=1 Tax=Aeribacillus kexueae TaxID=2078952 RepID=UPI001FAF4E08|nr:S1 domain-containing post-transcriptional regulator GSP13 [Bacillus kexueae]
MSNTFEIGSVLTGKVTGIQPYGAFVALNEETQGLVHISEITHGYVKDIQEHLEVGQEVNVKVLSVDEENGKISLSIRQTEPAPKETRTKKRSANVKPRLETASSQEGFNTLKEKLQEWIEQSKREDLIKK